jgi:hypothetical protein
MGKDALKRFRDFLLFAQPITFPKKGLEPYLTTACFSPIDMLEGIAVQQAKAMLL